jgi:beta-lactamase regulating signal transducer with metallopeptidase domain
MHLLFNWLIHGSAVTLVVALGVGAHRRMTAATRERLWQAAAISVAAMPLIGLYADRPGSPVSIDAVAVPDPPLTMDASWHQWAGLVLAVWAAWTAVSLARVALGLFRLHRARRAAQPFPPDRETRLPTWTQLRARGRTATLAVSSRVHRAGVLGLGRRPLIAVAPATLERLTDEELDQVVLHEYAHVQRRDDVVILLQRVMLALVGFHPAVRWLDRAMTVDREVACDDWVVAYTGARAGYARCLVTLAGSAPAAGRHLAPGAVWSRSQLSVRVAALLDARRGVAIAPSRATCLLAMPVVLALVSAFAAMPLVGVAGDRLPTIPAPAAVVVAAAPALPPAIPPAAVAGAAALGVPAAPPRAAFTRAPASRVHVLLTEPSRPSSSRAASAAPLAGESIDEERLAVAPLPSTAVAEFGLTVADVRGRLDVEGTAERQTPWRAAAAAGLALGSGSRSAARRMAGAFTRVGRSFANSF